MDLLVAGARGSAADPFAVSVGHRRALHRACDFVHLLLGRKTAADTAVNVRQVW